MIEPWYIAVKSFSPVREEEWKKYIQWSGLTQLEEVIGLDNELCPRVVDTLEPDDWKHNVQQDYCTDFFRNLNYLKSRIAEVENCNLLAVTHNPQSECREVPFHPDFQFKGYELIDTKTGISALTNCRGFPLAFMNEELSKAGLISELARAREIQAALREHYAEEPHSHCDIRAVWKMA
ncbi:hypothetical protein [Persicirhabdus sediminis]|uniref:Uncharacterized protein n=1 Tax=Persicirhabdus sediminis TaxID=454144 RepID=A0A8J7MBZ0_9BACT|nr:hypothetical protein [Persicirhabdus sediminis]MBK1790253.1 hypothetical protein [Persicirhabdus sediminis]